MNPSDSPSAEVDSPFEQALLAVKAGSRDVARQHLQAASAGANPDPHVKLWLAWLAETPAEAMQLLREALLSSQSQPAAVGGMMWLQSLYDSLSRIESRPRAEAAPEVAAASPETPPATTNETVAEESSSGSVFDFIGDHKKPAEKLAPVTYANGNAANDSIFGNGLASAPAASPPATSISPAPSVAPTINAPAANFPATAVAALAVTRIMPGALQLNCPHCFALLQTPETTIGKNKRCPACSQRFVVTEPQTTHLTQALPPQGTAGNVHQESASESIYFNMSPRAQETPLPTPEPLAEAPRKEDGPKKSAAGILPESLESANGSTILVVDDSPIVRKVVATVLERAGYQVRLARDGEEALEMALRTPPSLVLLDVILPGIDGFRVCEILKTQPATQAVPVLILSGRDTFFDRVRGRLAGCDDYLSKPCEAALLTEKVRQWLQSRQPELSASVAVETPSPTPAPAEAEPTPDAAEIDSHSVFA